MGGNYTGTLLLGISKRSLLEGRHSRPAYAAFSGWDADSTFSLVPSVTQVMLTTPHLVNQQLPMASSQLPRMHHPVCLSTRSSRGMKPYPSRFNDAMPLSQKSWRVNVLMLSILSDALDVQYVRVSADGS